MFQGPMVPVVVGQSCPKEEGGRRYTVLSVCQPTELAIQTARLHGRAVRKVLTRHLHCGVGPRCRKSIYGIYATIPYLLRCDLCTSLSLTASNEMLISSSSKHTTRNVYFITSTQHNEVSKDINEYSNNIIVFSATRLLLPPMYQDSKVCKNEGIATKCNASQTFSFPPVGND